MRDRELLDIYVEFCMKYKIHIGKRTREEYYAHRRQLFMVVCWETGIWTLKEIGAIINIHAHTTVIHGINESRSRMKCPTWEWYKKEYDYWKIRVESKISAAVA